MLPMVVVARGDMRWSWLQEKWIAKMKLKSNKQWNEIICMIKTSRLGYRVIPQIETWS